MFDKTFFEKAYKIGMRVVELGEYAVVSMDDYEFVDDGIKFIFYTYFKDGVEIHRVERILQFSFDEFMSMSINEIFERFNVVEDELEKLYNL